VERSAVYAAPSSWKSKTLNLPPDKSPSEDAPVHDPRETFLTDAQVEQRWNVASGYMSELRAQGTGPPHVRLSPRIIRYRLGAILAYEQAQSFDSNAAALEAAKSQALIEAHRDETPTSKPAARQRWHKSPVRKHFGLREIGRLPINHSSHAAPRAKFSDGAEVNR
jgi:hypothetical protein